MVVLFVLVVGEYRVLFELKILSNAPGGTAPGSPVLVFVEYRE